MPEQVKVVEARSALARAEPCTGKSKATPAVRRRLGIGKIEFLVGGKARRKRDIEQPALTRSNDPRRASNRLLAASPHIDKPDPSRLFGNNRLARRWKERHRPRIVERRDRTGCKWRIRRRGGGNRCLCRRVVHLAVGCGRCPTRSDYETKAVTYDTHPHRCCSVVRLVNPRHASTHEQPMTMHASSLISLATALPPYVVEQGEAKLRAREAFGGKKALFDRLAPVFDNAGIARRHIVAPPDWYMSAHGWHDRNEVYLKAAEELFIDAATAAIAKAGLKPQDIDGIVAVSTTGIATPSLDARCAKRIGFRNDIRRAP